VGIYFEIMDQVDTVVPGCFRVETIPITSGTVYDGTLPGAGEAPDIFSKNVGRSEARATRKPQAGLRGKIVFQVQPGALRSTRTGCGN
jgi:hypothetical protein